MGLIIIVYLLSAILFGLVWRKMDGFMDGFALGLMFGPILWLMLLYEFLKEY